MATTIGVLHPGAMGVAVAAALRSRGHDVLWASDGRSDATNARVSGAGLRDVGSAGALAAACEVPRSSPGRRSRRRSSPTGSATPRR